MMEELDETALFEAFEYLDELRESGRTNMWAASNYVQDELAWERSAALAVTKLWMETFDRKLTVAERVAQGVEAQRAETGNTGSVHESPVGNADAPTPGQSDNQQEDK